MCKSHIFFMPHNWHSNKICHMAKHGIWERASGSVTSLNELEACFNTIHQKRCSRRGTETNFNSLMDPESGAPTSQLSWVNLSKTLMLAYQSFGVVYGDLSTSPLYVYSSTFRGKLQKHHNEETIFGAFSLIFWSLTLIPLLKYVFILLSADDNGEGGTFALYTLLCRHAKFNLLPNQQEADKELSAYKYGHSSQTFADSPLKVFMDKHEMLRTALLIVVLFGTCMVIGDGVLTPAMSVLSSVSGLLVADKNITRGELSLLACVILVGLFALQHYGTHNVAFGFAPILAIWLVSIFVVGLYNTIYWNPKIVRALSPHYILKFFDETRKQGWISLGGIILCTTGTEAMFADLGHFTALSIRLAFSFVIYPCLVVQYMGQAAFLSKNLESIENSFFDSIPGVYLSAVIIKVPQGGWVPLVLSCIFMVVMYVWHFGTKKKHNFDRNNKASLKWLLGLGPCLGVVRVPGIGFVYSELATGVPAIFSHFVTNFPAFHKVLVFVCIKSVPVPCVSSEERFLIERVCSREYRMYRCTVRYGYKDIQRNNGDFENQLIQCIAKFILMEATEQVRYAEPETETSFDVEMNAFRPRGSQASSSFVVSEVEDFFVDNSCTSLQSEDIQSVFSVHEDENPQLRRRSVRFQLPNNDPAMDPEVREELSDLMEAKEAGVAYIIENSYVVARRSSSFLEKLVIDNGYAFLRKNCRGAAETFNVPHICLIEVGMIYYV
ncbi:hypothetical protein RIF29_19784 [Crotalaria pallida]|uniref:Potassium transporter n=1 Tax=Crotalaria pallida TaxID=3830 RepID=A0AAN9F4D6_CROPI